MPLESGVIRNGPHPPMGKGAEDNIGAESLRRLVNG
jgi:hypothetical protein